MLVLGRFGFGDVLKQVGQLFGEEFGDFVDQLRQFYRYRMLRVELVQLFFDSIEFVAVRLLFFVVLLLLLGLRYVAEVKHLLYRLS